MMFWQKPSLFYNDGLCLKRVIGAEELMALYQKPSLFYNDGL
jgi:hypothetical protein